MYLKYKVCVDLPRYCLKNNIKEEKIEFKSTKDQLDLEKFYMPAAILLSQIIQDTNNSQQS